MAGSLGEIGGHGPGGVRPGGVTVIGAGMAGAACVASLRRAGVAVRWCDRGAVAGGRMASPVIHGRVVDVGASYFTVRDAAFGSLVEGWADAGLARAWTDTFAVFGAGGGVAGAGLSGEAGVSAGPMRWAAPGGLAALVAAVGGLGGGVEAGGVEMEGGRDFAALPEGHVVLAMPDAQARRLAPVPDPVASDPAIAVVLGFARRSWSFEGAFVNGHPALEWVADDGARRGDGAPVLVAHTTAAHARRHVGDPAAAADVVVSALRELIGLPEPDWTEVRFWELAKPAGSHPATFGLIEEPGGRLVGLAGDQWAGGTTPRVESAWRSGTDLATALVARLG